MSRSYAEVCRDLVANPKTWVVTGAAGFIGSNLVETLLRLNQRVVGLDNFSCGHQRNLDQVRAAVPGKQWGLFDFLQGDIRAPPICQKICQSADYVLHQPALGSVPRSIQDPLSSNAANVTGSLNMSWAAKEAKVKRFVYASSSAVYGEQPDLPKVEDRISAPLSPYAVTKLVNEIYGDVFSRCYGLRSVGLRYFNVFGPRQDPHGAYAAVIPGWIAAMIRREPILINGDGETSRDFCYVTNVVQANILAAVNSPEGPDGPGHLIFNIGVSERTSLNLLFRLLRDRLLPDFPHLKNCEPAYRDFRAGDVRHSQADIQRARTILGYVPSHDIASGLDEALSWYKANLK